MVITQFAIFIITFLYALAHLEWVEMLSFSVIQFKVRKWENYTYFYQLDLYYYDDFFSSFFFTVPIETHPCSPSPCGPNSQCREINNQAVCSCIVGYLGSPPACRPECTINSDCNPSEACFNQKCRDPCPGTCGVGAKCTVINHNPICSCPVAYTGDPFSRCFPTRECFSHSYKHVLKDQGV